MTLLNNILTSEHSFIEDEYSFKGKITFLKLAILLTSLVVLVLTILLHEMSLLVYINSIFLFVSFLSLYLLRKDSSFYALAAYLYILYAFITVTLLLIKYPDEYIRIAWYLIITSFVFFVLGKKAGYFIFALSIIMTTFLYSFSLIHIDVQSFYVILSFLTLNTIIIGQYEKRENTAKLRLHDMNVNLEKIVGEKTKKVLEQADAYKKLAYYDVLTSLPNRTFFLEQLKLEIKKARRNHVKCAVLFVDLDNFKEINDLHGHQVGDQILQEIGSRLQKAIRESDTLARLGGDEFTLILSNISVNSDAGIAAQNLKRAISEPFQANNHEFYLSTSIGISIYPDDSINTDDLIKCADTAMYSAKKDGKNRIHYYQTKMTDELFERTMLETYIRRGIENNEFTVHYQPIIDSKNHADIGLEALVRWNHPQKGLLSPMSFIPIAEKSSLIIPLGKQVLIQVVKDLIDWHSKGYDPKFISVNLSTKQLSHPGLFSEIREALRRVDFRDNWLELEITESYTFQNYNTAIELLNQIRALGVRLSIDDFGTGYSSLSYLKKLPVSKLKIDRSFIMDIPGNRDDEALVRTIVAMGKSLGMEVVAEGIENESQKKFLVKIGCTLMQGYLFAKPMPKESVEDYLANQKKRRKNGSIVP